MKSSILIAMAVYTYLRLIVDHHGTTPLLALRQKEVDFCISLLRERVRTETVWRSETQDRTPLSLLCGDLGPEMLCWRDGGGSRPPGQMRVGGWRHQCGITLVPGNAACYAGILGSSLVSFVDTVAQHTRDMGCLVCLLLCDPPPPPFPGNCHDQVPL